MLSLCWRCPPLVLRVVIMAVVVDVVVIALAVFIAVDIVCGFVVVVVALQQVWCAQTSVVNGNGGTDSTQGTKQVSRTSTGPKTKVVLLFRSYFDAVQLYHTHHSKFSSVDR